MSKDRKVGDILLDMEPLLDELADEELQLGEILALIKAYYEIHRPDVIEEYTEGGRPIYYYGPRKSRK